MVRHFPAHFRSQQLEDMDLRQKRLGYVEYLRNELLGHWASYNFDYSMARACCACRRCEWGLFGHFYTHLSFLSSFSLSSLRETARYILKYCLKGPLNPNQPTNQLGHRVALSALVSLVNRQQMIPEDAYVPETEGGWLSATCWMAHWQIPSSFSLHPVNSQALLFYWRVLIVGLTLVSSEIRQEFRDGGWNEPSEEPPSDLIVVDSVGFW